MRLAELFRHRKIEADQAKQRGDKAMSRDEIEALEAELRDANACSDCRAVEFDFDTFEACREAGINIVGSPLDVSNRIYPAFVEAWLSPWDDQGAARWNNCQDPGAPLAT
jgi:hypothetical protein